MTEWNAHRLSSGRAEEFPRRVGIGYLVLTPVLVVLLMAGGGGALGFLFALVICPGLTMAITYVIGLPVRRIRGVRLWWSRYWGISLAGIVVSFGLIAYGFATGHDASYMDPELSSPVTIYVPEAAFVLPGWFMLSFFVTHGWITPRRRKQPLTPHRGFAAHHARGL